jgi:Tol biopolymer transport system component
MNDHRMARKNHRIGIVTMTVALLVCGLLSAAAHAGGRLICILDVTSGEHRILDGESEFDRQGSPQFSPDESMIIYDARRDHEEFDKVRMFVKSATDCTAKARDLGSGAMPSYSAGGGSIAFSRPGDGVWIMDANGENEKQIDPAAWHIAFGPSDDRLIAYGVRMNNGPNIRVVNRETEETHNLLEPDVASRYSYIYWNFQWSFDESSIAFVGQRRDGGTEIAVVGTQIGQTHHRVVLHDAEKIDSLVPFHPISGHIYFSKKLSLSDSRKKLFFVDPDLPEPYQAPSYYFVGQPEGRSNDSGVWSRAGDKFVFASREVPVTAD